MATIDQRIMIPAPIEDVWHTLSDSATLNRWDQSAKQVIVLTQRPGGVGSRRRCVDARGRSRVEEITAWLEPLGYEYKAVEGPYQEYTGRFRLQAVPDGTQVQWTIRYRLRGAFGSLRDLFGYQRTMRQEMADSLRTLRRQIESSGIRFDPNRHAKVAMQSDPGFEARRARALTSSVIPAGPIDLAAMPGSMAPVPLAMDLNDPDLPPIEALPAAAPVSYAPPTPSPVIIVEPPIEEDDTRRNAARRAAELPPPAKDDTPRPMRRVDPIGTPALEPAVVARRDDPIPVTPTAPPVPAPVATSAEPLPVGDDTGSASVWEMFGVTPPSQRPRAELDSLISDLRTPPPSPTISVERAFDRPNAPPRKVTAMLPEMEFESMEETPSELAPVQPIIAERFTKMNVRVRRVDAPWHRKATVRIRR